MEVPERTLKPAIVLLSWLTACYLVSFVGYLGASQGLPFWYLSLRRPSWDPPTWVFAPLWTILYALMGMAAWQLWKAEPTRGRTGGLIVFGVQLFLNGLWPWIFFAWHKFLLSTIEIGILWIAILATTILFWRQSALAGKLMLPYLAWVAFAAVLNFAVWRLNLA